MNKKVLSILQFNNILETLSNYTSSEPGREVCLNLLPSNNLSEIEKNQAETEAALNRILKNGMPSFSGISDLSVLINRLETGSILEAFELLKIADTLEVSKNIVNYATSAKEPCEKDCLTNFFNSITLKPLLLSELRKCILSETEIADNASKELFKIRQEIKAHEQSVHSTLNKLITKKYFPFLQDSGVTIRNGKYCLPVKAENKNNVSGIILAASTSGSTLFIEPLEIINIENKLIELSKREAEEIKVILGNLTNMCNSERIDIINNSQILKHFDFTFAKAKYALETNSVKPLYNNNKYLNLIKARHPLIDKQMVVPIDIKLGKDFTELIITGPNTGGKTVSLKTVGLLCIMGQAGLHIPASFKSELCVFNEIFADIGDEQSIESNLSTFSAHMTNIVEVIKKVDKDCLCLFDELCSGTDPNEGAALAISILSKLKNDKILTMATTHYSELKMYALSEDMVCNASCEFDVNTLRPTYKIIMGIPGKSNAFIIASKLGLASNIIENAKQKLSSQNKSIEDILSNIELSRHEIEKKEAEISKLEEAIKLKYREAKSKSDKISTKKDSIIDDAKQQANLILTNAKEFASDAIKAMRKIGAGDEILLEMENKRQELNKKIKNNQTKNHDAIKSKKFGTHNAKDFHVGDSVKILSMDAKGTVLNLPDDKNNVFVQMGIIKTKVNIKDLEIQKDFDITGPGIKKTNSGKISFSKSLGIKNEINLLGMTVDEAVGELEKYIDNAFLAHLNEIRIVHGKGTGALRHGIHSYLKKNKHIKQYRLGEYGEGDSGVTIATLK